MYIKKATTLHLTAYEQLHRNESLRLFSINSSFYTANSEETVKSSSDENDSDCDDFEFDESSLFEYEYQCDKKPKFGHELEIDEDFTFSLDTLRLDEVDLDDFNGRNSMMASFDQLERDSSVTSLPIEIKFAGAVVVITMMMLLLLCTWPKCTPFLISASFLASTSLFFLSFSTLMC